MLAKGRSRRLATPLRSALLRGVWFRRRYHLQYETRDPEHDVSRGRLRVRGVEGRHGLPAEADEMPLLFEKKHTNTTLEEVDLRHNLLDDDAKEQCRTVLRANRGRVRLQF